MKRWFTLAAAAAALCLSACQPKVAAPVGPVIAAVKPADDTTKANLCVNQCLTRSQMKAMSLDAIEKECRASCGKECMDACKARSGMRAVSADQIDADCKKVCGQ